MQKVWCWHPLPAVVVTHVRLRSTEGEATKAKNKSVLISVRSGFLGTLAGPKHRSTALCESSVRRQAGGRVLRPSRPQGLHRGAGGTTRHPACSWGPGLSSHFGLRVFS